MRVEDFTFEQRPLSELPADDPSQWLADFGGDDFWFEGPPDPFITKAVVVSGTHLMIWQACPLTYQDKQDAIEEATAHIVEELTVD